MSFWHRLEPNTVDEHVEEGIQARVADPLWLLARQWQFGEFKGEDAASPIHARLVAYSNQIKTFRNEAAPSRAVETFSSREPLECRVEAESVLDGPAAIALAAEAGLQFLRRLDLEGLSDARKQTDWRAHFKLNLKAAQIDISTLPEATARRLTLLERRGLDGRLLAAAARTDIEEISKTSKSAVGDVFDSWRVEYGSRLREPGTSGDCWRDEQLEYGFSLGVSTGEGEVVLAADEYIGGHLDWHAFRVESAMSHGLSRKPPTRIQREVLPTPATFRGQAAPRWWEFEDRSVYFGNLSAGPADIARLMVAEYGVVSCDDWFVIPLRVDIGSLNRVSEIEVLDVFGDSTPIVSTAVNDRALYGDARPFRFFELDGDDSVDKEKSPWLLVPPALADSQNGKPVELVTLVRDEAANLGWAIEQRVELPTGEAMERRRQWQRQTEPGGRDVWRYRLQTPVPPWWIPLIPERFDGAQVRLRRARMQSWEELDSAWIGATGRLIGAEKPMLLREEAVPRGGVQISRGWQRARGSDGRVHLWMARRKRPGRGDRRSGLEFDGIER